MDTVWIGKGCSFIWYKSEHYMIYRQGVMHVVHLVVDNWRCMLMLSVGHILIPILRVSNSMHNRYYINYPVRMHKG